MNQKKWVVGLAILIVLAIVGVVVFGIRLWRKNHAPQAHQRQLIANQAYCDSNDIKPCVESFSVDADNNMLVSLLIPDSSYPNFYLTIGTDNLVNNYKCEPVKSFPTHITCTGVQMYPGAPLQFTLISLEDDTVLAEGKFAIIGLLLPNPDSATETPLVTETIGPTETPTPISIEILTPLPSLSTQATLSYPNPTSYPNPFYP